MIIGTHNSGAYKLDLNKGYWPFSNKWEIIRQLSYINYVKTRLEKTVLTQNHSITQQLNIGCRALDIRISIYNNLFFVNHTYCCIPLEQVLLQIKTFLLKNATKITIFLRPDWETRHTVAGREFETLNYIDDKISGEIERGKIECFCDFPKSILRYFDMKHYDDAKMIWFNVDTVLAFETELARAVARKDLSECVLNFVLTISEDASIRTILRSDVEKMAAELNAAAPTLIRKYFPSKYPKAILFDFLNENLIKEIQKVIASKVYSV